MDPRVRVIVFVNLKLNGFCKHAQISTTRTRMPVARYGLRSGPRPRLHSDLQSISTGNLAAISSFQKRLRQFVNLSERKRERERCRVQYH